MKNLFKSIMCILFALTEFANANPPVTSGLIYNLDAKDLNGNGTAPADGATVPTWVNKAGTGNATLVAGSNVPTYDADGFDTTNDCGPGVRFGQNGSSALFTPDIFGGSVNELTMFLVSREIVRRPNFTISLNGTNYPSNAANVANSRLSLHLPWTNNFNYFDFNGCCNAATGRTFGASPAALGGVLYTTAYQSQAAQKTGLRGNGALIDENNFGTSASTQNGISVGSISALYYNGLIGEVLIYDRYLSATEINQVEEYIRNKWIDCTVDLQISKTVDNNTPDENGTVNYTISVTNNGPEDATNITVTDNLPAGVTLTGTSASSGTVTP